MQDNSERPEDEDGEPPQAFLLGMALPPEVIAAHKAHNEHVRMAAESRSHEIDQFLDGLDIEQLRVLRWILEDLTFDQAGHHSSFLEGSVAAILVHKFKVCGGCGKDHGAELLKKESEKVTPPTEATPEERSPGFEAFLKEYGMTVENGLLVCKSCGTESVSMDDRMLRPPGVNGCGQCQQNAKWGG